MAATLGSTLRNIRKGRGWTLAQMSEASGIALSTLSKIENDKLTLTYDKLQLISRRLGIGLADLFAEPGDAAVLTGRRSIARLDDAMPIATRQYLYNYLCTDLRKRLMIPMISKVLARSIVEFGELIRHGGEEFIYVLDGSIELHTELYSPTILTVGEGTYLDSSMGHAYVLAPDVPEATILAVCASADERLQGELLAEAEGRRIEPRKDAA